MAVGLDGELTEELELGFGFELIALEEIGVFEDTAEDFLLLLDITREVTVETAEDDTALDDNAEDGVNADDADSEIVPAEVVTDDSGTFTGNALFFEQEVITVTIRNIIAIKKADTCFLHILSSP